MADAEFIAHAPEDMRRLLAEVERLHNALEIANGCLFGNTQGDRALEEAYRVIHRALEGGDTP